MKTQSQTISSREVNILRYNSVVVGAGAAGMNCAKKLYEYMDCRGVENPQRRIAVIAEGLSLGASRMSGSDKQTYYKMGTSPLTPDSAVSFAESLTAGGCCHGDLALAEAVGSLRSFYSLVEAGVAFPHDGAGAYIGYKTDHDPFERATSAGPRTSQYMSRQLEKKVRQYGVQMFDNQLVFEFLAGGSGKDKRVIAAAALDTKTSALNIFVCKNLVLAAGGCGGLYRDSVYPLGQIGLHGAAFRVQLAAENLSESQFGLASTKFRWNVSGTYMQAVPRIFSTDAAGNDERDFCGDYFPDIGRAASAIFLKGYQWPFDPAKIANYGSSGIDVLVFNETQKGRRVFMDFRQNPVDLGDKEFTIECLLPEAQDYLAAAGALQRLPIERLEHMNPLAVELYKDNGIDLHSEPLEIAVCAQHNNGGFAVDRWWQSNIPQTFVIGEMAGTHGVKRPGGSALNAGQVGGQRAAEYIVNVFGCDLPDAEVTERQIETLLSRLRPGDSGDSFQPEDVIADVQRRMSESAGHIRRFSSVRRALAEAVELHNKLDEHGLKYANHQQLIRALHARDIALASVAYLSSIAALLGRGGGSRGSYLVLDDQGVVAGPDIRDIDGKILKFKQENKELRNEIMRVQMKPGSDKLFECESVPVRPLTVERKAFESAWADFRAGRIYDK